MTSQEEYPTVKKWLSGLSESSQETYLSYFNRFMKWLSVEGGPFKDYTPDMLIEYQQNADNGSRYDMVDLAQRYVTEGKGRVQTKNNRYANIKSFFMHNRCELPRDPNYRVRSENPPIQGTLTPEEIKKVILSCNPAYQAAYMVMFQGALDQEMFKHWNTNGYDDLVKQLRDNPEIIKVNLPGRKKNRNEKPYYSFIGRDGIDTVKNWLQHRPENAKAIITNQFGDPLESSALKTYWIRHLRKMGLVDNDKGRQYVDRTGKGLHEMRDVRRSLWTKSPASSVVCEYTMGHSIDALNYDKSFRDVEFYQGEYMKALPFLNLLSSGAAFGRVEVTELDRVKRENRELRESMTQTEDTTTQLETAIQALMKRIENLEKDR